ncbi:MAG: O-antigen ligase family protein [Clostridia bacterium]|nr:O-antigen ligase family protein [Clostridia bacterium]
MNLKIKENRIFKTISCALSWRYFPFITAVLVVGFYYLEWDLVSVYYLGITGILSVLLLENLTPLISNFLFMGIIISEGHSPTTFGSESNASEFLFQPAVLGQIIAVVSLYLIAIGIRIFMTVKSRKFKLTPAFYGLAILSFVFILNGLFSKGYSPTNLLYGFIMALCFLGVFALMKDNVICNEKTFTDVAFAFMALSASLVLELFIKYVTTPDIIIAGEVNRGKLGFGWGMYNNMGMLMMLCLPSIMFIAGKHKYGYLFYGYAVLHSVATVMTMSRQAIFAIAIIFPVCLVMLLWKGKNRLINAIISGGALAVLIVLIIIFREKLGAIFELLTKDIESGNGRMGLWEDAIKNFKSAPLFGTGFFVDLANDPGFAGLSLIPDMYHNTIMQLLASCGLTGLIAYLVHRAQTIVSLVKKPSLPRIYIAVTVLSLLIVNLLDNHLFYILPTIVYSCLISILIKSENTVEMIKPCNAPVATKIDEEK